MNFYQLANGEVAGFDAGAAIPEGATEITAQQYSQYLTTPVLTSAQALAAAAKAMLAAGLDLTSTATPALNGTYAVDQFSQSDIVAIETSLNAGKGFPGGATSFGYPDATGALHTFSEANFSDFAAAVRDFVYSCKAVISGQSTILPNAAIVIA